MPDKINPREPAPPARAAATTSRPDAPELEGGTPQPEEVTGRASATDESLGALFENESAEHLADGFRGGSDDDEDVAIPRDDEEEIGQGE